MLDYTNAITEEKSYSGLQMKEFRPVMKLMFKLIMVNPFGKSV